MPQIALNNATFAQSTAANHINYKKWEYQYTNPTYCNAYDDEGNCISTGGGDPVYDWNPYQTNANINGKALATVSNVRVNGISPIVNGDSTTETDSYTIPSGGQYVSGAHSSTSGDVISGNSRGVFINGKSVSVIGSNVRTHANTNTTINSGGSSNVYIG